MRALFSPRFLVAGAVVAVLWVFTAGLRDVVLQIPSGVAQVSSVLPELVPTTLTVYQSGGGGVAVIIIGGVVLAAVYVILTGVLHRPRGSAVITAWFALVLASAVVGLGFDVGAGWTWIVSFGPRGLLTSGFGAATAAGALWGLAVGWIPALIAHQPGGEPTVGRAPLWLTPVAVIAVVGVSITGAVTDAARTAAIAAENAAQQEVDAASSFGAVPDPDAPGVPVPETADAVVSDDPQWCTPERATILKGEPDAATGHRGMPLQLLNFSDQPCVIEGYPDVALGDQNGHLLEVTIEHGRSFMAQDPGPQRVEVPAGGEAVAVLGWDAASPHGALVTKTVWAAPTAGMVRGSWPIELDIVEGSTVAITAWTVDTDPTSPG
ncbi:DUF4232 domain-containing protein [Microbacterium sp. CFBP 8790]|uniref:DUF4232 domain-containing protein n=1 Tax=unclassified Microbacterium TaxID=2609290 RepID=UPI001786DA61|nr:DUF4232 domain-containing protein [Microbacterium sp. CFBP 8801]MBD8511013.1 DUF4232 domain-containing protein [Microbacterium sp. CFBP 8790]